MEFDTTTTAAIYLVLLGIIVLATSYSPMQLSTILMVVVGLTIFGGISLYIGVKHGEYRATH